MLSKEEFVKDIRDTINSQDEQLKNDKIIAVMVLLIQDGWINV